MAVSDTPPATGRRARSSSSTLLLTLAILPILAYLIAPTLVVIPMAFTASDLIQFPPVGFSTHAFTDYFGDAGWIADTIVSIKVAAVATVVAGIVGTCTALALHAMRGPARMVVSTMIMLPMMIPLIVLALGDYFLLARLGLEGQWFMIGLAHSLLGVPYVVISVQSSLGGLNQALVRSARSLGAGSGAVFRYVLWPALRPGLLAGLLFAFYGSFDEVVIALFLQGPNATTLPVQMFTSLTYELTPKIAAVSSLLVLLAAIALVIQSATSGPRRLAASKEKSAP